jgi:hypothetical protein
MRRGLLFEADQARPRFIWIPLLPNEETFEEEPTAARLSDILGGSFAFSPINSNPIRNRDLEKVIGVFNTGKVSSSSLPVNRGVASIVAVSKRWLEPG